MLLLLPSIVPSFRAAASPLFHVLHNKIFHNRLVAIPYKRALGNQEHFFRHNNNGILFHTTTTGSSSSLIRIFIDFESPKNGCNCKSEAQHEKQ